MRSLILAVAACTVAPAKTTPVENVAATAARTRLAPVVHAPPAAGGACELRWNEVGGLDRIELTSALDEECTPAGATTTETGRMHGGIPAQLTVDGPNGSGRFFALGLAVGAGSRKRFACATGSTVGWRLMHPVATQLAPLPFLADVDRDGSAELVVWSRLPWGDSEVDNALFPIVYVLDGDVLVRRDDRAKELFVKVATAYRARAQMAQQHDPTACLLAVAQFLES